MDFFEVWTLQPAAVLLLAVLALLCSLILALLAADASPSRREGLLGKAPATVPIPSPGNPARGALMGSAALASRAPPTLPPVDYASNPSRARRY